MCGERPCLYLVDGSSYIHRAFHALPPLTGPGGVPTQAVYGFTTMLLKLLAEARPQYMAILFDAPGATFRDEVFTQYKANRPAMPDDLRVQIPFIHQVVEAFRLCKLCVPGVEADDVIATLAGRHGGREVDCVVVTGDKDMMQLVGPGVRLWDTMRDRWIDAAAVEERFGVKPSQVVDVMALMGDAVDNSPGVKGIGEKTAIALIQQFGDLDSVLARLTEVESMKLRGAKKVAERLRDGRDTARLSRALVSAKRDVELPCVLDDFRVSAPDIDALRPLFTQLGFHTLLRQLSEGVPAAAVSVTVARDAAQAAEQFARARAAGWLALACVGDSGPVVTTPARELIVCAGDEQPLRLSLDDAELRYAAQRELREPGFELIGHDLKSDFLRLAAGGVSIGGHGFDVMIAAHLVDAPASHDLEELAAAVLGIRFGTFRDQAEGAALGVKTLQSLYEYLRERLRELDLERLFEEVEMPLVRVLADIERRGMLLDVQHLQGMSAEFAARLDVLMDETYRLAGGEFNINSPPQLRAVLFDKLGLSTRGVRRGKTGYSTDVDVLTRLAAEHPLPGKILEYRNLAKVKSTYVDALPAAVNPVTGRLHTTLNQTVAATGRLTSSDPNLQNIPVRGEEGRRIRQAFVAPPDHLLVAADYSQIELRVLAHLSRDPALIEAFQTGQDIHTLTAAEVFGVLPATVSGEMRRVAKVINFGILYGMGPQRLASELGLRLSDAQRYIARYFSRYAGGRAFLQGVVGEARERGFVTTIMGRRRAIPELRSTERGATQAAERVAANTPIQGSAADLIKLAMIAVERRLARAGLRAAMILQVHDELLLEVAEPDRDAVCQAVREEMEQVLPLAVPLSVDVGIGGTWAEAH
jgi:DNA polymerase-1